MHYSAYAKHTAPPDQFQKQSCRRNGYYTIRTGHTRADLLCQPQGLEKAEAVILPLFPVDNSFLVQSWPIVKERIPVAAGVD